MLYVYCKLTPDPEKTDEFLSVVKELIDKTRTEPGCVSFELVKADNGPYYALAEKFIDRDALRAHTQYDYFTSLFPRLKSLLTVPPEVTNHDLVY